MKKITFILSLLITSIGFAQAPAAGPTAPPARDAGDVVSFYGGNDNSYTNVSGVNFVAFGGGGTIEGDITLGDGQVVIEYANHSFSGIGQGNFDVSQMEFLHIDFYSPVATNFRIKLESPGQAQEFDAPTAPVAGQWMSYDIDLSLYPNVDFSNLVFIIPVTTVPGAVPMFLDNIYFYRTPVDPATDARLSALEVDSSPIDGFASSVLTYEFPVPAGTTTVPQITTATATQAGASVVINQATTVPGTATVVVTSSDTSTSQTYTVNIVETGPSVAAPTPPALSASDVVSIYSDAFTEIPGINYDAGFCGTGAVTEITPGGNAAFAYNSQACQGIDFDANQQDTSGLENTSGAVNFHVDLFIQAGTDLVGKVFNVLLVHPSGDTPVNIDINGLSPAPVPGTWYSFDTTVTLNNPTIRQVTVVSNLSNSVWYDNLYLFNAAATASTNDFLLDSVQVSPNPSNNIWNIESSSIAIETVEVYDLLGKRVLNLSPNSQEVRVDASGLRTGIYLAKLTSEGATKTIKLVKN